MRLSLICLLIIFSLTGCLDTDGEIQGSVTNGSTSISAGDILNGTLPAGVLIGDVGQLPAPIDGSLCNASEILEWTGTQWDCIPTPTVAGGAATSVPVAGIGPGALPLGVSVQTSQLIGSINPNTQMDGSVCSAGQVLISNGTVFNCVTPSTIATSVPAAGITAGALGVGVSLAASQLTGCVNGEILQKVAGNWDCVAIPASSVTSVHGRGGIVVSANGDYTASEVTNVVAGNISATTVQTAINELDSEKLNVTGGTLSGALAMGTNKITGLGAPTVDTDAVTKLYVDTQVASSGSGDFLAAGTVPMTGNIELDGNWLSGDGGNEGVFVDGSGNVGVGTSSPNYRLEVNGEVGLTNGNDLLLRASSSQPNLAGGIRFLSNDGSQRARIEVNNGGAKNLRFTTATTVKMIITEGGNVGIGTVSPGSPLHIESTSEKPVLIRSDSAVANNRLHFTTHRSRAGGSVASGDNLGGLAIGGKYTNTAYADGWNGGVMISGVATENWSNTNRGGALIFGTTNNASIVNLERMRISPDGDVGIGTSSPAVELDVNTGSINASEICDENNANCIDLSNPLTTGTVTSIASGTGLTGGPITGSGTLNVDVGVGTGKILEANAVPNCGAGQKLQFAALPLGGWSCVAELAEVGDIESVVAGTGLTGGSLSGDATLNVNVGTGASQIVQLDGTSRLPAVDGSLLTNLPAAPVTTVHGRAGVVVSVAGDYTATEVTNVAAGNISGVTVQAALNELDSEKLNITGGALSGALAMGTNKITGLGTPTLDADAATKLYVDTQVASSGTGDFLASGAVPMTGNIELDGNYLSGDGDAEGIFVDGGGDVGIGTATPGSKLDIDGAIKFGDDNIPSGASIGNWAMRAKHTQADLAEFYYSNGTSNPRLDIRADDDGISLSSNYTTGAGEFRFGNGNVERMRIDKSGNVGIGTTSPSSKLQVAGGIQIANDVAACAVGKEGTMRYNGGVVEFCDGTAWIAFGTAAGGEINTASNIGVSGVGLFDNKSGVQLQFKNINNASSKISISDDVINNEVDIDVVEGNIDHDALSNFVSNEHVDHSAVSITAGTGLTGGGTITTSRTLNVNVGTGASQIVQLDGTSRLPAVDGSQLTNLPVAPVTTVHGRAGVVVSVAGDYTATEVTNVAAGNISGVTVQAALNELDSEKLNITGGALSGALAMGANKITGLGTPTLDADAATKLYVDTQVASTGSGDFLASGAVPMTGNIELDGNYLSGDGDAEGVFVDGVGNVGIGTASPGMSLELNSSVIDGLKITGPSFAKRILMGNQDGGGVNHPGIIQVANGSFSIGAGDTWTGNGGNLTTALTVWGASGRVGVGTVNPAVELDVNTGVINASEICDENNANCIDLSVGVGGGADNLGSHTATSNIILGSHYLSGDGGDEGIFVTADGRIGVGTAAPLAKFHIVTNSPVSSTDDDLALSTFSNISSPAFAAQRARGTLAVPAPVESDDAIGSLWTSAFDGASFVDTGSLAIKAENNFTTTAADQDAYFSLDLLENGLRSEKMRVTSSGSVGIGTSSPAVELDVNTGSINASEICDENNANCIDLSSPQTTGTVTSIASGTGLTGGPITGSGTLNVDVGVGTGKILEANAVPNCGAGQKLQFAALPLGGWSCVAELAEVGDIESVVAGTGLTGGSLSGDATLNVNVGTGASQIVQLDGTSRLPAVDGSLLTNLPAAPVTTVHGRAGVVVSVAGDYTATEVTNVAAGNISGVTVQAALNELDSEKLNITGGALSGALAMGTNKITGLGTPTLDADAATKLYVDTQVASSGTGDFLASGAVPMTGNIELDGNYLSGDGDAEGVFVDGSGNVGVGTSNPLVKLHIHEDSVQTIQLVTTDANLNALTSYRSDNDGTIRSGSIGYDYNDDVLKIVNGTTFDTSSNGVMIDTLGNVGIGTATPTSKLQVAGGIQIANDVAACAVGKEGTMRYNGGVVEFCDGTAWIAFGTAAGGEVNTASNVGVSGVGLFDVKSGVQLQFKNINNASSKISISDDVINNEVDIDVVEGNIDHDALSNFVSNEHVDHSAVSITAGTGLTGGGTITTSRTLNVNVGTGASQIVQLDGTSRLPAVDGSLLTNLPAAPVTTVHGRAGVVVSVAGDYTATEVTNVAAGNISGVTVQAAINELDSEKLALAGGTLSGTLAMGANKITGLGTPTLDADAATKLYVDTQVASTGSGDFLASGAVPMTGNIELDGNYLSGDGDAEGVFVDASGNVGIGTSIPLETVHITKAGAQDPGVLIGTLGTGVTSQASLSLITAKGDTNELGYNSGEKGWVLTARGDNNSDTAHQNDLLFSYFEAGTWVTPLFLDHTGWVGVGTSVPDVELDVHTGSINAAEICDENNANCIDLSNPQTSGTVTSIIAGTGLDGGTITGSGTISIAAGGVDTAQLSSSAVTSVKLNNSSVNSSKIADGTITNIDIADNTISAVDKLTSSCSNNQILQANGSGNFVCASLATAPVTTVHGRAGVVVSVAGDYTASEVTNVAAGDIVGTTVQAAINELDSEKLNITGGTLSGVLAMGTNKIIGLGAPTVDTDAATKLYVDTQVASSGVGDFLADGTVPMTGNIELDGHYLSGDGDAEGLFVDAAGNVGMGTTSPVGFEIGTGKKTLHLYGNGGTELNIQSNGNSLSYKPAVSFTNNGTRVSYIRSNKTTTSAIDGYLTFGTHNGSSLSEKMRIDVDGNVGIGTAAPIAPLSVGTYLHFGEGAGLATAGPDIRMTSSGVISSGDNFYINIDGDDDSASNKFVVSKDRLSSTGGTDLFVVQENGNVGIGTTSPEALFHSSSETTTGENAIFENTSDSAILQVRRANGTKAAQTAVLDTQTIGNFGFAGRGATGFASNNSAALKAIAAENFTDIAKGTHLSISTTSVGTGAISERVRVSSEGNVGIGTTNPSSKLFVQAPVYTATSESYQASRSQVVTNPTAAATGATYASYNYSLKSGAESKSSIIASIGYGDNNGTGTVASLVGAQGYARNNSTGLVTTARGAYGYAFNADAGTITTAIGSYGRVNNTDAAGTITNAYGVYADVDLTAGTITNAFGLYIADISGTNTYGLYQVSAGNDNYFAGNVGVSTASPEVELDVGTGSINASAICDENNTNCIDLSVGPVASGVRSVAANPSSGNVEGDIVYNTTDKTTYVYNGTAWEAVASSGGSNSVIADANPTINLAGASSGDIAYNSTSNELEYYNGASWVSTATAGGDDLGSHTATANLELDTYSIEMADGTSASPALTFGSQTTMGFYKVTGGVTGFSVGGSESFRFRASGIAGPVTGSAEVKLRNDGSETEPTYTFRGDGDTGMYRPGAGEVAFTNQGVESLRIDPDGKVGIGTSTPSGLLTVGGGGGSSLLGSTSVVFTKSAANALSILNTNNNTEAVLYAGTGNIKSGSATNHNYVLMTNNTDRLTITSAGNVGIGTSSPSSKFVVQESSATYLARFINTDTSSSTDGLIIQAGVINNPDSATHYIRFKDGDGDNIASIRGDGAGSVSYSTTSDFRAKDNIVDTQVNLEDLMQVQVRDYNYKTSSVTRTGFVAQELYDVYKTAVNKPEDESKEMWSIDYAQITPLIVKAVQDLTNLVFEKFLEFQNSIAALFHKTSENEKRIADLESKNQKLEKELAEIRDMLKDRTPASATGDD